MPTEVIPFGANLESGNAALAGAPAAAYNVVVDGRGALRRRPAIATWSGFPGVIPEAWHVDGIHDFDGSLYYVTRTRRIWNVVGAVATVVTQDPDGYLDGAARPTFAETRSRLLIAGGGHIEKVDIGTTLSARLGGDPPHTTHVAALASRLFVPDKTAGSTYRGRVRFSGTGATGEESWDALDTFDTESSPDDLHSLYTDSNELWAFGTKSLQVYKPDPYSTVAPMVSRRMGCAAPYSVVGFDNRFAWLNHKREFVVGDGRSLDPISGPIDETLDSLTTVDDCYGFRIALGQYECLVWHFPTEARTFAWQVGGGWSEWAGWTPNLGYTALDVQSAHYWEEENLNLVGTASGRIAMWSTSANQDLGGLIKAECQTGFLDRGTSANKLCRAVRITRKGNATGVVRLSWRDDTGSFWPPIEFTLADHAPVVELRTLGTYRTRQWSLDMTDAAELLVAKVEEDFDVLGP